MKHFLLFYDFCDDYLARRPAFRESHLRKAWDASARGELLLAGALADPVDGGVLLFRAESPLTVERFAETDPYVTGGLVTRWRVREWTMEIPAGHHRFRRRKPGGRRGRAASTGPAHAVRQLRATFRASARDELLRFGGRSAREQSSERHSTHPRCWADRSSVSSSASPTRSVSIAATTAIGNSAPAIR
jgi:uncharacterized protein